jgi:DNA-binding FadR family transcriptional regulator
MEAAVQRRDMKALIECDLDFHISLAEASGNPLLDVLRRLLAPLFAFIQMRVMTSGQGPEAWSGDLPRHQWIIKLIREGNPSLAGQYVQHSLTQFAASAYAVWENVGGSVEAHNQGERR